MKVRRRAVTGRHTQTSRLLSAIETLIQLQSDQIENASSQGKHMADIKCLEETQLGLDDKYLEHLAKIKTKREIRSQWETEVLTSSDSFFEPPPTGSLQDVLQTPFWLATEYAKAYPKSFSFLSQAAENARLKLTSCRVCFYNPWLPSPNPNGHQGGLEWVFPRRSRKGEERRSMADQLWEVVTAGDGAQPPRTICVQDMSPSVGAVLMATTPRSVASNLCPFLERYLSFENFGKASLLSIRAKPPGRMNCFIFEYHFAFYYVTKQFTESNMTKYDSRGLRTSSCFGGHRPDANTPVRHIHEEQMSFFLAGDGTGKYYCYQLGEKYFKTLLNNEERTCVYSAGWTPSILFLSWIAMALHHVGIRWQNAIEAVDELVDSEKEVVFHKKNSFDLDQRAKERKIAQLRTYFWVLEAYKLFEDSLTRTVEAWEHFERGSLPKTNDGRNDDDYEVSVELIELSIERLRKKIEWVRKRSEQVSRLREGLSFAAQMSDTSVAISQNDNIRLLTYFNILFLPLSLSATLFSMQFLQGTQWQAFAGVTALMTLTTIMTVLLITHKGQDLVNAIGRLIPRNRGVMTRTFTKDVSGNIKVQNAAEAVRGLVGHTTEAPSPQMKRRVPKRGILASLAMTTRRCFITFPVNEAREAMNLYGLLEKKPDITVRDNEASKWEIISMYRHDTGASQMSLMSRKAASTFRSPRVTHSTATGTTSQGPSPDPPNGEPDSHTLRGRVRRALETWPEPRPTRKWRPPIKGRIFQQAFFAAFCVFRAFITLSLWMPLLLLGYLCLLIYGGLHQCITRLFSSRGTHTDALGLDLGRDGRGDRSMGFKTLFAYPLTVLLPSQTIDNHQTTQELDTYPQTNDQPGKPGKPFRDFVESRRPAFFPHREAQEYSSSHEEFGRADPEEQHQQQQAPWLMTTPTPTYSWSSRTPSPLGPNMNLSQTSRLGRSPLLPTTNQHAFGSPSTAAESEAGNQAPGWDVPTLGEGDVRVPTRAIIHRRGYSDLEA